MNLESTFVILIYTFARIRIYIDEYVCETVTRVCTATSHDISEVPENRIH